MRRILILFLLLSMTACSNGQDTPPPSTPVPASATPALPTPTLMPGTSAPTEAPATQPPPSASTFPDPSAYDWQPVVSGLERPDDLQADGSSRLFVIEKVGRIRIIQDGQLLPQPFLDITDRVGSQ